MRWPRHRLAVEEIEKEVALLPALAPHLPVEVPRFEYVSREPWLVAYRFIRGEPLVAEDPDGVRTFLETLHTIDVDEVPAPREDWLATYREQADHSDLGPEHLLVRDGRLAGVIDWGDARIGDPALDYAWLLDGPFRDWDVDDDLRRRARVYHRLAPWFEAHSGVFTDRPERVRSGLAGVRSTL